ncbi:E3 ubiquitin-protein ligase BIG BROTHER-like isoform X2 [Magnolia sinica]|uniref:E3 ubiquitin-protein ligase BIG BROTHER-like isoform X2 n=1 Tax=Magnolia sinica TaxID=86752 RepID=UPI00265A2473|nr:E3 ubiquitin-protein ligase BIG BROTHER-like isoform X2 [Magnolia sinica]
MNTYSRDSHYQRSWDITEQFEMNSNRQAEVHYIDTGFPFTITESFMDLFEGLTYVQADFALAGALQENSYWSMHMSPYKYGLSGSGGSPYYSHTHGDEVNDNVLRMDESRRAWYNSSVTNNEVPPPLVLHGGSDDMTTQASPEECSIRNHHNASSSQVIWQDNIDLDNMTYEELLDLGEAVGTHSRGLSQERISSLPISKYKSGFFSRKKSRCERCVICQMDYKRGDRQMTLPCKHIYHANCVTRWLSINKACPVCYIEVFSEESRH